MQSLKFQACNHRITVLLFHDVVVTKTIFSQEEVIFKGKEYPDYGPHHMKGGRGRLSSFQLVFKDLKSSYKFILMEQTYHESTMFCTKRFYF